MATSTRTLEERAKTEDLVWVPVPRLTVDSLRNWSPPVVFRAEPNEDGLTATLVFRKLDTHDIDEQERLDA